MSTKDSKSEAVSRRAFLQGVVGAGVIIGIGGLARATASPDGIVRPPGGQDEALFLARCLRCDRCAETCPTKVIGLTNLENGFLQTRTPVLKFHLGYCTFCGECLAACPTGALAAPDPKQCRIGVAKVDHDNCIAWQWGACTACKDACDYHALSFDSHKRPVIDPAKCNGCGKCEYICPAPKMRSFKSGQTRGIVILPLDSGPSGQEA